ncbi:hypothetical protein AB0O20_10900 [Streptomyces kronopolitis]|uniref:hypothetical protein n=1 Tax=Streptomyces kronopolitis TaxID=1612435 RepID=UPI00343832CA
MGPVRARCITAQGQPVGFLFLQGQDRHEHIPTEQELARAKKYSWAGVPRSARCPGVMSRDSGRQRPSAAT